jgi:hypothetical protein
MSGGYATCAPGHGVNRVTGHVKKKGGNKGILAAKRERKRLEAEARNAKTPFENTRAYRRRMQDAA